MAQGVPGGDALSPPAANDGWGRGGGLVLAADVQFTASAQGALAYRPSTGLVARLGLNEWQVLQRFDGSSAEQVRDGMQRDRGLDIATADLVAFGEQALAIGLLERPGWPLVRPSRSRGLSGGIGLWNPGCLFAWCARRATVLFHPAAIGAGLALVFVAARTFVAGAVPSPTSDIPVSHLIMIFALVLNVVSIFHECGHGVALHRYGGCAREIGVRFVLGWPCWYCDITESYLLPMLRHRLAVILAGPFVQAVVCAAIVLAAQGAEPHVVAIRRAAALLGALGVLNFFPLIRSDGYYLLTELTGMPNLRTDAWRWLTSSAARHRMRLTWSSGRRLGVVVYAIASAAFTALVLTRAILVIGRTMAGAAHVSIRTAEAALTLMVVATVVARRRSVFK